MTRFPAVLMLGALFGALALAPRPAAADDLSTVSFEIDRARPVRHRILIATLGGAATLMGGVGLLFNLDSRDKAAMVAASGRHTGLIYDEDREDIRKDAVQSRDLAVGAYAVGAGLLIATMVTYIVTDPGTETIVLDGGRAPVPSSVMVAPLGDDGALVGGRWAF